LTDNLPILIGYSLLRISCILTSLSCFLLRTELTEVLNQVFPLVVLTFHLFNLCAIRLYPYPLSCRHLMSV